MKLIEWVLILALVAGAAWYVWRHLARKEAEDCGSGCGHSAPKKSGSARQE